MQETIEKIDITQCIKRLEDKYNVKLLSIFANDKNNCGFCCDDACKGRSDCRLCKECD